MYLHIQKRLLLLSLIVSTQISAQIMISGKVFDESELVLNKKTTEIFTSVIKNQALDQVDYPMTITKAVIGELTGNWRGVFTLKPGVEAPFNFIIREEGSTLKAFLVNGEERFPTVIS